MPTAYPRSGFTRRRWLIATLALVWLLPISPRPQAQVVEGAETEQPEAPLYASRIQRDRQLLAQAEPEDIRWLETPSGEVVALYRAAETRSAKGALLMLHTADQPPGWPPTLEQLRRNLPLHGWATLAMTLPEPSPPRPPPRPPPGTEEAANGEQPEAPEPAPTREQLIREQLTAVLALLRQQGQLNIILLVDNAAVRDVLAELTPALRAAARQGAPGTGDSPLRGPIRALILVNMQPQLPLEREELRVVFGVAELPVMDIFFSPENREQALIRRRHRAEAMRAQLSHYQPVLLPPPASAGIDAPLEYWSQRIRGFMQQQALGVERPNPDAVRE